MRKFLQEFQAFISRGNVLDLAVAVIIGAAFSSIVNSLVKDIINPLVGFIVGRPDFTNLFVVLRRPENYVGAETYEALTKAGATVFGYGAFLTAVVNFVLLAFVIFLLIKFVTQTRQKLERLVEEKKEEVKEKTPDPIPENVLLLREIRDLLKESEGSPKHTKK